MDLSKVRCKCRRGSKSKFTVEQHSLHVTHVGAYSLHYLSITVDYKKADRYRCVNPYLFNIDQNFHLNLGMLCAIVKTS